MENATLRKAAFTCLGIWAAIWVIYMLLRFSPLDYRWIPGIGFFLLGTLVFALLAPIVAAILAGIALIRQPGVVLNWMALLAAIAVFCGQGLLFAVSKWM